MTVLLACAKPPQGKMIPAESKPGEWRQYGNDLAFTRYSPLDQITRENAKDLKIAWHWKQENFGAEPEFYGQTTPIYVDGVLYATAGYRRAVVAIDPATGETLWMYRMDEGERGDKAPRKNSGRGVSFWTDGQGDNRIFVVTIGFYLVGLNAETGQPIPSFGKNGVVDLMEGLRGREKVDVVGAVGSTSPPTIVNEVIVVGPSLAPGFRPKSMKNVPGDVRGFDVRTGKLLWTFHTVPEPGELGSDTWKEGSGAHTGNTGVWTSISADPELGYVYLPVEAPTNDYYGGHRPGDNLFANSLVCLEAKTGKRVWHYQIVHHDVWDYDNPSAPILANLTVDGKPVKAVIQNTKQGFSYVFDRVTGQPVWPIEERPVGKSDVPGEQTAPTQLFPTNPPPFERQGISTDDLIDFTPKLRAEALEIVKKYRLGPLFTPPSLAQAPDSTKGTIQIPGANGGVNWNMTALDPETGINYIASNTSITLMALKKPGKDESDMNYISATLQAPQVQGLPLVKPPWGRIVAVDMNTGKHLWMVPNGDASANVKNNPALKGVTLPRTGKITRFGTMVTKTLLFAGEGFGGDPKFHAYDKKTGEIVAELDLPAAQVSLPMTYLHKGKQYIVMSVGAANHPAELVAFSLPEEEKK
ncbi:MAG: pyrroloquinoline quinone-dependent dehydrogenase [Candidatus Latescibacteria bacterium]|nr:pyrroloquinoline quinone-dependent dehydrogenase [Candidatus Latescibacterota bacterium]